MTESSVQQRFCGDCGKQARNGAAFCVSCGVPLSTPEQSADHAEGTGAAQNRKEKFIDSNIGGSREKTDRRMEGFSSHGEEFDYRDPLHSFFGAARGVLDGPTRFFDGMAKSGDYINPTAFALICLEIYVVLNGLILILFTATGFGTVGEAVGSLFVGIFIAPIAGAVGLFIRAGILHLMTMLIIKPKGTGFETTLRASAYSLAPLLVAWVPFLGPIIAGIWGTVLTVIGIREAHSTTTGKAAAVVLIPTGVVVAVYLAFMLVIWLIFRAMMSEVGM